MSSSAVASYTLETKLHETATTLVYRGFRHADGLPVVVKVLREELPNVMDLMRLRQEYALLHSFDVPGVVRPIELGRAGHGLELVLEDAGDTSLHALIESGRLDIEQALGFAIAATRIVASVHGQGIVHKDLKPQHFVLKADDPQSMVLVDFGLATRLSHTQAMSPVTQLEGSLSYIAPEQTGRMNRVIDKRSDLYSLGVLFYELFAGCLPFQATDPTDLVHSHIARQPRPPREANPAIPKVLSDIILRLLSKVAEDRYQSAVGLLADLERSKRRLNSKGEIPQFPLGEDDAPEGLTVPQRMYGRQAEIRRMIVAFEQVKAGDAEVLLLLGQSGIGKSALVAELQRHMGEGPRYAASKFDHLSRGMPYAPLINACRQLVHSLLVEPHDELARRATALLDALGPNGKLIVELIPELETVIGVQPNVPELGPTESQRRLELVLQRFLMAFAEPQHPLVLFLDDLQWADAASLRLLEVVLSAPDRRHCLMIGAYRDGEVDAVHPLTFVLDQLRQAGVRMSELTLGPLGQSDVQNLVADTFRSQTERVTELAAVLFEKTRGNPFFLHQMLVTLYRDELIRFDPQQRAWEWDLDRVREALVTDNVVEFMIARLRHLSPAAQEVLRVAACVGHRFDSDTLGVVTGSSMRELHSSLWEALQQGLILPLDSRYRYGAEAACGGDGERVPNAGYRFLHDRVQQAAYALIDPDEKEGVHLNIGRLLLAQAENDPQDDHLFGVVDHLNQALRLVTGEERNRLARLNLSAGQRARAAAAPASGIPYLEVAIELLGEDQWSAEYGLAFSAHLLKAACEYLVGNLSEAFRLLDVIEEHAATVLDRCAGRELRMELLSKTGRTVEACKLTVEVSLLLGVELPAPDDKKAMQAATGQEFGALQGALAGRDIESLAELAPMVDPHRLALMRAFVEGFPAAFQTNQEQFALLVLKSVALSLSSGLAPSSSLAFAQYGVVHLIATGDYVTAYRFGKLGVELGAKTEHAAFGGSTHFIFGGFLAHWRDHVSVAVEHLLSGLRLSLESGDVQYAAYCASVAQFYRLYAGTALHDVEQPLQDAIELSRRMGDVINLSFCQVLRQLMAALRGKTEPRGSLYDAEFDREKLQSLPYPAQSFAATAAAMASYLAGDFEAAVDATDRCQPLPANFFNGDHMFYRALALVQQARVVAPSEQEALLARAREACDTLKGFAETAPSNHASRYALVRAELAAFDGKPIDAMDLYEQAIQLAHEHDFTHLEALGNELCGDFHLAQRRPTAARGYLQNAHYCYGRWGATDKLRQLGERHPRWFDDDVDARPTTHRTTVATTQPTTYLGGSLDLAAAIRTSQTVVSELVLDRVVEQLMQALLENSGAQRGFLVLARGEALRIEAAITVDPDRVAVGLAQALVQGELASTVVRYVARVKHTVVLADASRDQRFASDPYVVRCQPKSIVCVPMMYRGSLTGVLYLENNLATDAFSPARTDLLQLLASQAAAATENARLYGELSATTEQLRNANDTLESQVASRTAELQRVLGALWSEMDLARKIQTVLLPVDLRLRDYDVAAAMIPAEEIGGDYYDVISRGSVDWVLIGDVSGHGVTAGLIMMMVQSAVRAVLQASPPSVSPVAVLAHVNASLWNNLAQIGGGQYMTISALRLEAGKVTHAGLHQDIFVHRGSTSQVERVETDGLYIGLVEDISTALQERTIELAPGDTILLYSDGLPERQMEGDRRLGIAGLARRFAAAVERSEAPQAIVKTLLAPVAGKNLEDDATVVALRYAPGRGNQA
ncbi:MAG: AAA family ATPase [Polyangiaceae bacterium]|nr:AAA family ATPase [Polyangiaceae bacterium]